MSKLDWEERAAFMREVGATEAEWSYGGELIALKLAPVQSRPAAQPAAPTPGPAAKVAESFASRLKRDHEIRFAASHFKPRLEVPETTNDVPRAVLAKSEPNGRAQNNPKHR